MQPRQKDLALLGLGYSVGTPKEGITANAIVVNSFADLKKRAEEVNLMYTEEREIFYATYIFIRKNIMKEFINVYIRFPGKSLCTIKNLSHMERL